MKFSKITEKLNKVVLSNDKQDFIPIVSYYNKDTLLTKNGDLLQTITINGLQGKNVTDEIINLREAIWQSISKNINDPNITCWIHTVRFTTNIDDDVVYNNPFADKLHKSWQKKNFWHDKFINKLYITFLYRRPKEYSSHRFEIKNFFFSKINNILHNHLKSSLELLTNIVSNTVEDLKKFGSNLLQIYYKEGKAYSESISFYKYLVTLEQSEELVPKSDISSILATADYKIHSNNIEINASSNTRYISFFTLKDYINVSESSIDQFLQMPLEFIVTEIFCQEKSKILKNEVKNQSYILDISRDEDLKNMIGISDINDSNDLVVLNQTTIGVIASNQKIMQKRERIVSQNLIEHGIAHKLEDINAESIFWSQLPGNLHYINNLSYTPKNKIAQFTSLNQHPIGSRSGVWGKSVTILRTIHGTPYFVNLHNTEKKGHTAIFGDFHSGKTVLTNFLLSLTTKVNPQILYLSSNSDSLLFLQNLNIPLEEEININPFSITNYLNSDKEGFVYHILEILCNTDEKELAKALSEEISNSPEKYKDLIESFHKNNPDNNFIKALNKIIKTSDYKKYCAKDIIIENTGSSAYNLEKLTKCDNEKAAITYGLIKNFIESKIDTPKILVIDNFLQVINHDWFTENIITILEDLNKNNGILIANIELEDLTSLSSLMTNLLSVINTKIILPSKKIPIDSKNLINLTNEEIKNLANLSDTRFFLYKQDDVSIMLELSLRGLPDILSILSV